MATDRSANALASEIAVMLFGDRGNPFQGSCEAAIGGESKSRTLAAAYAPGPVQDMPVRAVLRQSRTPVDVMWSP